MIFLMTDFLHMRINATLFVMREKGNTSNIEYSKYLNEEGSYTATSFSNVSRQGNIHSHFASKAMDTRDGSVIRFNSPKEVSRSYYHAI